ncbi:M15 family metallopeptidase [Demequina sp. B12]|uniref:M15 family metallopeptidase n=1 Tax=Demequina sp. B12 TaxID=2992757 RepID=UPI00237C31A6|nr:M15 family metallopeptidase [Demequina sp. B12]MDE0573849.1 M15 family metallopeptidase [Demequina sp. B12]
MKTTHRRRKFLARSGVLAGFALTMIVYPAVGTIAPYAGAAETQTAEVVASGDTLSSRALIAGQSLESAQLPLPAVDGNSAALAVSTDYAASAYLPDCDPGVGAEGYNGRMTADSLCEIWNGVSLRNDAAVALAELNEAFKLEFGRDLCVGNGYRTLSAQYATKASRGFLAAAPGKSVHGWGLALDLCGSDDTGYAKAWLEANGRKWGWVNPSWAKSSKWEPWHWEYEPGTDEIGVYGSGYWSQNDPYFSNRG